MGKRMKCLMKTPMHQSGNKYKFQFQLSVAALVKHRKKESSMIAEAASVIYDEMSNTSFLHSYITLF